MKFERPRFGKGKKKSVSFLVCDSKDMNPTGNMPLCQTMAEVADNVGRPLLFVLGNALLPRDVTQQMSAPCDWMKVVEQSRNKATMAKLGVQASALNLVGDDCGLQGFFDDLAYGVQRLDSLCQPLFATKLHVS